MAFVFERPGSRFWWIRYRDPVTGKIVRRSTGIDVVSPDARRLAKREEADWTLKEMAAPRINEKEQWASWAEAYLNSRYEGSGSLKSALLAFRDLLTYFRELGIRTPRMVTYQVAAGFIPWRLSNKTIGAIKPNTARLRFVYLSVLMSQAVRLGFCAANPCREVELRREPAKEKEEITTEHQALIEKELAIKPQWMRDQWLVLMRQGCRVGETSAPLRRINTDAMTITFRLKGGKLHTAQLHPDLLPLIAKARSEGRKHLIEGPPVGSWPAIWSDFFKRRGLPYSIHCTRVTVITRLVRSGHPQAEVCNFIGHTQAVSKIYQKLKPPDSMKLLATLAGAPTPSSDSGQP